MVVSLMYFYRIRRRRRAHDAQQHLRQLAKIGVFGYFPDEGSPANYSTTAQVVNSKAHMLLHMRLSQYAPVLGVFKSTGINKSTPERQASLIPVLKVKRKQSQLTPRILVMSVVFKFVADPLSVCRRRPLWRRGPPQF